MKCDNEDVVNTNMISADTQQNQINNKILEGTLIHRKGGRLKKNMRMVRNILLPAIVFVAHFILLSSFDADAIKIFLVYCI